MITAIIIGILIALLIGSGWLAYGITLQLIHQRDVEKARYKKALELEQVRHSEALQEVGKHIKEREEAAQALGRQEGKRAALDWIKQQVDDGTIVIKVVGQPKQ